jgi:hypothetical protein
MEFFLNELSLHGQYVNGKAFKKSLEIVLQCKNEIDKYGHKLYCNSQLALSPVIHNLDFKDAIKNTKNLNFIRHILTWTSKTGPFWEVNRHHSEDDWLENESKEIITNSSLAETAWRTFHSQNSYAISFVPSKLFNKTPLKVIWKQSDEYEQLIDVENFWQIASIRNFLNSKSPTPKNWEELMSQCIQQYTNLTFADDLISNGEPFFTSIANRIKELLAILDELNICFDNNGCFNERGKEIITNYFCRKNALFTDESVTNKDKYEQELTFKKPNNGNAGETIFCPFHGKIKSRQYRIHFNWPKAKPTDPLYIVYIGPKITKN